MFKRDLRAALKWAGIAERPELFDDSNRRASLSIRFHDLRASGITWRHARRDNPQAILQECGHEDQATNAIYIRALRGLAPGELFPELPERLLGKSPGIAQLPKKDPENTATLWAQRDLNPRLQPCEGRTLPLSYAPDAGTGLLHRLRAFKLGQRSSRTGFLPGVPGVVGAAGTPKPPSDVVPPSQA
jgi:hypothetical protein